MGVFDKFKWGWDSIGMLTSLIGKWRPRNCETEKDYENNLYLFLHRELEGHTIEKQSGRGRFHADIVIDNKLVIEIKYNLRTTANYQRLIGQVQEYNKWDGQVILLLIGKTDPNLKKQLFSLLKEQGLRDSINPLDLLNIMNDKVIVVEK
jgi:hypothetical protein